MILWTIVPEEVVYADPNQTNPTYEEIEYAGQKIMAQKISQSEFRVVRLLTTDPSNYLRNELQPGTVITYKPVIQALS